MRKSIIEIWQRRKRTQKNKMIIKAILLSMVVASISFFVAHSYLAETVRAWVLKRSKFFGLLVECPYCFGHWIAVAMLVVFPMRLFGIAWPVDYFLTWLVISWLAGLQSLAASRLWGD